MRRWATHGEDEPLNAARPSHVSRDRLAERIRCDVADVRTRLEEAVLRGDAYLAAGRADQAAAVLDEQQALMAELRAQLEASVAAAVVEAEAEAVLSAAPEAAELFDGLDDPDPSERPDRGVAEPLPAPHTTDAAVPAGHDAATDPVLARRAVRGAVSALASAVAAVAVLVSVSSPPAPQTLAAAGIDDPSAPRDDAAPVPGGPDPAGEPHDGGLDDQPTEPTTDDTAPGSGRTAPSGSRADGTGTGSETASLTAELQALVDQLRESVMELAEAGRHGPRDRWEEAVGEGRQPDAEHGSVSGSEPSSDGTQTTSAQPPADDTGANSGQADDGTADDGSADASDGATTTRGADGGDDAEDGPSTDGDGDAADGGGDRTDGTGGDTSDEGDAGEDGEGSEDARLPAPSLVEDGVGHAGATGR